MTSDASLPVLDVRHIGHTFGATRVLSDVSFTLDPGAAAALLGPSGCGKTTLLRLIAGFEVLQSGEILLAGTVVSSRSRQVPPERRGLGMVFQDFALFPHLTVAANIAFGLNHASATERKTRIGELTALTGLQGLEQRFPHELSGGQQQRVALARALAPRPGLVLLDEPFSSLDVSTRARLATEVSSMLRQASTAAILVTHDQDEAFAFADVVGVMDSGSLAQWDTPDNLYLRPQTRFVAGFVGEGAWLPAMAANGGIVTELGCGLADFHRVDSARKGDGTFAVLVRPEAIVLGEGGVCTAEVVARNFRGATVSCTLRLPSGTMVIATVPADRDFPCNSRVPARLAPVPLPVFPVDVARSAP